MDFVDTKEKKKKKKKNKKSKKSTKKYDLESSKKKIKLDDEEKMQKEEEEEDQVVDDDVSEKFPPSPLPLIEKTFPNLGSDCIRKLGSLATLVKDWNDKVNLISRKDVDKIEERHILMSLLISKVWTGQQGHQCLDIGTGGGFPGIPLAIVFPKVTFTLLDRFVRKN